MLLMPADCARAKQDVSYAEIADGTGAMQVAASVVTDEAFRPPNDASGRTDDA